MRTNTKSYLSIKSPEWTVLLDQPSAIILYLSHTYTNTFARIYTRISSVGGGIWLLLSSSSGGTGDGNNLFAVRLMGPIMLGA